MVGSASCLHWSKILAVFQCLYRCSRAAHLAEHLERREWCHQRLCSMHPASGLSIEDRDRVADALEAPWGIRQERRLRGVFAPDRVAPGELTRRIADVVNELGLQPWKPP